MVDSIILCGGKSTRFNDDINAFSHKFLAKVQAKPILQHVVDKCSTLGGRVILSGGYRMEEIKDCIKGVTFVDSGDTTPTAGRIHACKDLIKTDDFLVTYADGLTDLNLEDMHAHKTRKNTLVSALGIPIIEKYGLFYSDGDKVTQFIEKPKRKNEYMSGGYFFCSHKIMDMYNYDNQSWEYDIIPKLVNSGKVSIYRYGGFWMCVDTKEDLARAQGAPLW